MSEKRLYDTIIKKELIPKGFSRDIKYRVTTHDGENFLLRVSPIEKLQIYKKLSGILEHVTALGVPMCNLVEFGICQDGAYALYSWIFGETLSDALPKLSEAEQYRLGVESGKILRLIHSIPAPDNQEDWSTKFVRDTEVKIKKYKERNEAQFDGGDYFIKYIDQNRNLPEKRPQCFTHGDYNVYNMMIENGKLRIIDFDRISYADPWEEFLR